MYIYLSAIPPLLALHCLQVNRAFCLNFIHVCLTLPFSYCSAYSFSIPFFFFCQLLLPVTSISYVTFSSGPSVSLHTLVSHLLNHSFHSPYHSFPCILFNNFLFIVVFLVLHSLLYVCSYMHGSIDVFACVASHMLIIKGTQSRSGPHL